MSYKKNNVVIVIMVSLLFIISSAIVYFLYFFDEPIKDDTKDSIYVRVSDPEIIKKLKDTIENNNLIELAKNEKTLDNINTASNELKLNMSLNKIIKDYKFLDTIDATLLNNYFNDSFKDTIYYNKEDILCSCKEKLYIYDKETNSYIYNEKHEKHEIYETYPYYTKVLSVDKKNNIYVIKVAYVWNTYKTNEYTNTGYSSYNDSIDKQNPLFEIKIEENASFDASHKDYYAIKEIETNYEKYKNRLHKYIYTFEENNNTYKLISFKYEK